MFRACLTTAVMATALLGAGPWTAAHAQPAAVVVLVDNPWKLVAKGTLQAAVVAAEKFSGGRVLEIRFRTFHGAPGFDAVVAKAGAFSHVRIAIPSDVVTVIAETEVPEWMAAWTLKADARSLQQAKLHLVDAITKAETITDAPAVDAGVAAPLTGRSAVLAYNVEVIKRDRPERVAIDAQTGDAIANPEALLETWTPEKALYESLKKAPAG